MESLSTWLQTIGLERYGPVFEANGVDLRSLSLLGESDLETLGVLLGHRKLLLNALSTLDRADSSQFRARESPAPPPAHPSVTAQGERRQLTVMFCDLVGSTSLSERLDPEELRDLVRAYQASAGEVIARFDGYIAQFLGDGLLVYFSHPVAHEDDAERAVRAGLGVIVAMRALNARLTENGHRLSVRIGIHTGLVVVGEIGAQERRERLALGETPNLAARLQGIAEPDTVVISERTRQLVGGSFACTDLGEHLLKGISQPTRAWLINGVSAAASRFEAATHGGLTPLVGRRKEIDLLIERWQQAQRGEGHAVLLAGEPGIGKSRILNEVRNMLDREVSGTLRLQCSPYHINSAFYPSIDNFERALKFGHEEPAAAKLDKLEALLVGQYGCPLEDVRLIAPILSLPCEDRYGPLSMTPQQQKEETSRALVGVVEAASRRQPTLMIFEDAHWADTASLEGLERLIARIGDLPLLLIITHRPEFQHNWSAHRNLTVLTLSRLSRDESSAIVSRVTAGKALPAEVLEQIIGRTDGVPLFVEELTRSILEAGTLKDARDHYRYAGSTTSIAIPATLRDSLMARLDRVTAVKEIAQIGAAIGREFSYELISAVAALPKTALDDVLTRLTDSGLAFRRGAGSEAVYVFKHALVQDAAYESLLKSRRRNLHREIAVWYERERAGELSLLAHHWELAEDKLRAAGYLEQEVIRTFSIGLAKQSVDVGLHAAELLGLQMPTEPMALRAQTGQQMREIAERMAGRMPADLISLPALTDPAVTRAISLLLRIAPFAFQSQQIELFALLSVTCLRLTLEHGSSPQTAEVYSMYSVVHRALTGERANACAWSHLAIDHDQTHGATVRAKVALVHGWFHSHWVHPLANSLPLALDAAEAGFDSGDIVFACGNLSVHVVCLAALGRPLAEVMETARVNLRRNAKRVMNTAFHLMHELQFAKALAGLTVSPLSLTDNEYDEARDIASILQTEFGNQIGYYLVSRVKLHAHFGDWCGALQWAQRARSLQPAFEGQIAEIDLVQFQAIAALAHAAQLEDESAATLLEEAHACVQTMREWADLSSDNFAHKAALLEAMLESVNGDAQRAGALYVQAAALAEAAGYPHDEALAHELEARFHHSRGEHAAARKALDLALAGYRVWGAEAKVRYLSSQYGAL
ncbi:MAG: adenylate/guanylate cyclase domain-containing protein [Betaproteobacteria bacterium]